MKAGGDSRGDAGGAESFRSKYRSDYGLILRGRLPRWAAPYPQQSFPSAPPQISDHLLLDRYLANLKFKKIARKYLSQQASHKWDASVHDPKAEKQIRLLACQ
jgi:hypothetical protein